MTIRITCPHCQRGYTVAETQEGKTLRCKECKETFVAQRGRSSRPEPEGEDARPRRRPSARDEDDEERERPRRRRKKGGVPVWAWLAGGGAVLLLLLGVVAVIVAIKWGSGGPGGILGNDTLTVENFLKLRHGMSKAEVSAIFGPPNEDAIPNMPIWYRGPADHPSLSLSTQFEQGKLTSAELVKFTEVGKTDRGKPILDPEVLAVLDQKGARKLR